MNRNLPLALVLIAHLLLSLHTGAQPPRQEFPAASPESVGLTTQSLKDLDAVVQGYIDRDEAVGAELMVIKNRKTVWHSAHGLADRDAKTQLANGSIYCVRSMTKPLVGAAIQMLIDEGKISLSDHAAKYLPAFDTDTHRDITMAQLLTHTSGLPLSSLIDHNFKELASVQDVAELASKAKLQSAPGERFSYSDDGTDTLTAIIEKASGEPVAEFIQHRILDPLGMTDTMPVAKKDDPRRAKMIPLYVGSTDAWTRHWSPTEDPFFNYFLGSQALYSTCADYARFLCLWADGGVAGGKRLLSADAVTRALTPARDMGFPTFFTGLRTDYAQLWMVWVDPTQTPPKRIAFGHGGSDGTEAWMWPDKDLIVLYFTQSRGGLTVISIEKELDRLLLGGTPTAARSFEPYLGVYWDQEEEHYRAIVERDGKLNVEIPGQFFGALTPAAEPDHWKLELSPNVELAFKRGEGGRAASLAITAGNEVTHLDRAVPSADLPTLDALVARVLEAHGTPKYSTVGVIRRTGTTDLPKLKRHLSLVHMIDGPKMRVEVSAEGAPSQIIINDGEHVWNKVGPAKAEKLAAALDEQTRLEHPISVFGDWRKDYKSVTVVGRTKVDDAPAIIVRCVPERGYPTAIYVSDESGLVIAQDKFTVIPGLGTVGVSVRYSDYRDIPGPGGPSGVRLPFRIDSTFASAFLGESQTIIDTAQAGVPTDANAFKPSSQAP